MKRMPAGARAMKLPMPQPGSSTVASAGTPRCARRRVHGLDDHRRGVEGREGGAPGAGVVLGREERPELVPQRLPAGVFVLAGDRVREDPQGHRAEAGEAGEHGALLGGGGPLGLLDGLERADRRQDGAGFGFLAAGGVTGGAAARGACGIAPLQEAAWWRSTLLTTDGSGMVEKVMVRLLVRCTVIKSQRVLLHLLARFGVVDRM